MENTDITIKLKKWHIAVGIIILILIIFFGGFFLGRKTIKTKEKVVTEYIQGPTIHDSIPKPEPYLVHMPIDTADIIRQCVRDGIYTELFPEKVVTEYIKPTAEDTTEIMRDWAAKRYYSEVLFDIDTLGYCKVNTEVQYNRMSLLSYDYTPIIKTITKTAYRIKAFSPFIGIGAMMNPWDRERTPMLNLTGGFFIKESFGVQLQYQYMFNKRNNMFGGNLLYKF